MVNIIAIHTGFRSYLAEPIEGWMFPNESPLFRLQARLPEEDMIRSGNTFSDSIIIRDSCVCFEDIAAPKKIEHVKIVGIYANKEDRYDLILEDVSSCYVLGCEGFELMLESSNVRIKAVR